MPAHRQTIPHAYSPTVESSAQTWDKYAPPTQCGSKPDPYSMMMNTQKGTEQIFAQPIARTSAYSTKASSCQTHPDAAAKSKWAVPEYFQNNPNAQAGGYPSHRGPSLSPPPTGHAPTGLYGFVRDPDLDNGTRHPLNDERNPSTFTQFQSLHTVSVPPMSRHDASLSSQECAKSGSGTAHEADVYSVT